MRKPSEVVIKGKTLQEHLDLHKKWSNVENGGVRLNLSFVDLSFVDLRDADLSNVDLRFADLRGADLRGANMDFSQLNLSCNGLNFKIDEKQAKQLMYHVINLMQYSDLDVAKVVKKRMYEWLEDSHLVTKHNMPKLEVK